ncbi:hypothetical protein [Nibricoccus aquaticus]|uniref:hypothetical protein n=1 Tax=Nibricoccus aquaticus TaxID=2576891 RepID=UPI0010FCE59B|nr:hypothetical protein [Nibricoccus aquaticus]
MSRSLPFLKFFPNDWQSDERLRLCSLAARGLWIEILCLMWKSPRRGYLEVSAGVPVSVLQLARLIGETQRTVAALIAELESAGVFSREENTGVIFSRRIVKDMAFLDACSAAGRKGGGNPALKGTTAEPLSLPLKVSTNGDSNLGIEPQKLEPRYQNTDAENAPPRTSRFVPPAAEEVAAYSREIGYQLDGAAWCDSYAQKGWVVGKSKMKDWRAAVRTWKANGWKPGQAATAPARPEPTLKTVSI